MCIKWSVEESARIVFEFAYQSGPIFIKQLRKVSVPKTLFSLIAQEFSIYTFLGRRTLRAMFVFSIDKSS